MLAEPLCVSLTQWPFIIKSNLDDDGWEENQQEEQEDQGDFPCPDCGDDPCTCWPQEEEE